MKKKIVISVLTVLFLWICVIIVDFSKVYRKEIPIFSFENGSEGHYVGLGYSFNIILHPISGEKQFAAYLFGIQVHNNFTN